MNLFAELLASSRPQAGPRISQNRRGIEVKSDREIGIMRQSGRIVATVLKEIMGLAKPGMTTGDLDAYAESGRWEFLWNALVLSAEGPTTGL